MTDTHNGGNGITRMFRRVPIGVWTFLFTQLIAIVIFAVRLDNRVTHLEQIQPVQDAKIESLEKRMSIGGQAIIRSEERINNLIERLGREHQQQR